MIENNDFVHPNFRSVLPPSVGRKNEGGRRVKERFNRSSVPDSEDLSPPLITVITVVYNGEKYLEQSIQSVLSQNRSQLEYIIIDGGSTDGTFSILKKYDDAIDYWISEPDRGIYDAMNKGWILSRGDYIYFLGADDTLIHLPFQSIKNAQEKNIDLIYGKVIMSDGRVYSCQYNSSLIFRNPLNHQGIFVKRTITDIPFNTQYPTYADFDFNQRLYKKKIRSFKINFVIALFRLGGSSNLLNPQKIELLRQEFSTIIYQNFGLVGIILSWFWGRVRETVFHNNVDVCTNYKILKHYLITHFSANKKN